MGGNDLLRMLLRDHVSIAMSALRNLSGLASHHLSVCLSAIIVSKLVYVFFRPHRFIFNFGFGFNDADELMSPVGFLFASLFIELSFEFVIDTMAVQVEENEVRIHKCAKV